MSSVEVGVEAPWRQAIAELYHAGAVPRGDMLPGPQVVTVAWAIPISRALNLQLGEWSLPRSEMWPL